MQSVASVIRDESTRALLAAVDARLAHMRAVAAIKWTSRVPIEDLSRESTVLEAVRLQALALGLETGSIRCWFIEQMVAAREVQRRLHDAWRRDGLCSVCLEPPDLRLVRRRIDAATRVQLQALHVLAPSAPTLAGARDARHDDVEPGLQRLGRHHGLPDTTASRLFEAYCGVHRVASYSPDRDQSVARAGSGGEDCPFPA